MKFIIFIGLLLVPLFAMSASQNFFAPVREGKSKYVDLKNYQELSERYDTSTILKKMDIALNQVFNDEPDVAQVVAIFQTTFESEFNRYCGGKPCRKKLLRDILKIGRFNNKIDDVFYMLVNYYLRKNKEMSSFQSYLYTIEYTRYVRSQSDRDNTFIEESAFNVEKRFNVKIKKIGKLTPRQRLYVLYDESEIELLGEIFSSMMARNFSLNSSIVFELSLGNEEIIDLSSTEQYRLALRLLDRDIERALGNGKLRRKPMYMDLLAVGVELGLVSNDLLNELVTLEELKDPTGEKRKQVLGLMYNITKTFLVVNPATSLYALPAFLIIESVNQARKNKESTYADSLF